ncbi:MAG: hypothetical protein F6J90_38270 [Moorea sp. SIOASIH]|uniref:hypothetical protein n=1 Tax=Moorena sp. SIOASIH TaxID=2607817 RepID=UPI0013BD9760|nr:hypothetical protein [Moorena sp. SIOASIH]NEO41858.1 hypothetical protein [Moorena sp. SIOASIH]
MSPRTIHAHNFWPCYCRINPTPSFRCLRYSIPITSKTLQRSFLLFPVPCSLFPVPCSLFPVPCSLFPVPCSLFPVPCSLFPVPYSLLPTPYSLPNYDPTT